MHKSKQHSSQLMQELRGDFQQFVQEQNNSLVDIDPTLQQITPPSSYLELFTFADKIDVIMMIIASIFSIGNGISIVFYSLPIGELVKAFSGNKSDDEIVSAVLTAMIGFLINSVVVFFNCWFMTAIWTVTSQRQMITARKRYFEALVIQQQGWHDRNRPIQLCQKMYVRIAKVHQSLVTNMTSLLTKISMGCAGVIIALATGWKMALVMIAFLPAMMFSGFVRGHYQKKKQMYMQTKKVRNDSEVIQVFDNIKTVKMLNGQNHQYERYHRKIQQEEDQMWTHGKKGAIAFSFFFFCIIMNYTLGFWYGSKLVSEREINSNTGQPYGISQVVVIFFTLYISNLNLSGLPDNLTQFSMSRYSMAKILQIIKRRPKIGYGDEQFPKFLSMIRFKDIQFKYDKPLFRSLNLKISEGMTAFVGPSGCGKSTIIALIMRFYDPQAGEVCLINSTNKKIPINSISEQSLRTRIGFVGQQPVLIGSTIRQALLAQNTPESEIYSVLDKLKSSDFVKKIGLDQPFTSLSGGQKQRIAIARALLRKPTILILDESTSALDRKTQQVVLSQLKKTQIKFIIMIAHRPQTIARADNIIKIQQGKIAFEGTYNQLKKSNIYSLDSLLTQQNQTITQLPPAKKQKMKTIQRKLSLKTQQISNLQFLQDANQQQQQLQNKPNFKMNYICRLMKLNQQYWYLYFFGIIGAIYFGCIFPFFSYILSKIIIILSKVPAGTPQQISQYHHQVSILSLILLLICVGSLLFTTIRWLFFQLLTCKIGSKTKLTAYHKAINKQYRQIQDDHPSTYSHIIIKNCQNLKPLAGNFMPTIIQNFITLVVGLSIAVAYSWQMTLTALGILPLILLASKAMMSFNHGMQSNTQQRHKQNHQIVVQTITNIKTIRSCRLEKKVLDRFGNKLDGIVKIAVKYGNLGGIMFGIGQTLIFCMIAVIFLIGALLIKAKAIQIQNMYIAIIAIMFAGVQAGGNLYFLSQLAPAKYGACKYFQLLSQQQQILISQPDPQSQADAIKFSQSNNSSLQQSNSQWKGSIKFTDICFKYQTRKQPLFNNFNLQIKSGQKVAIVGQSGSGKSTIINLLFKLYNPTKGKIIIDGVQSKYISRKILSNVLGIVMQQPVLFNRSVYDNIKYNTKNTKIQQIITTSKKSNAYEFITERKFGNKDDKQQLQEYQEKYRRGQFSYQKINQNHNYQKDVLMSYMRNVGTKGSYLSGGQKQRIAIARSLIRKPKILILDEATSALDPQNQKQVQRTLEQIQGMTQIIIAHRLSTIKNCDKIVVLHAGEIVESGTYQQLLKKDKWFKSLVSGKQDILS